MAQRDDRSDEQPQLRNAISIRLEIGDFIRKLAKVPVEPFNCNVICSADAATVCRRGQTVDHRH